MINNNTSFPIKLKNLMKKNNITQKELAQRLGVSKTTVSLWLRGKNSPRVSLFKKLYKELDCLPSDLIEDKLPTQISNVSTLDQAILEKLKENIFFYNTVGEIVFLNDEEIKKIYSFVLQIKLKKFQ